MINPVPSCLHILIIDDEILITEALRRVLSRKFKVTTLNLAVDAQRLFSDGVRFDAILCDMMMPGFSGMDLFDWLQENHPDMGKRLIFTSGGAFTKRAQVYLQELPQERFMPKPFDVMALSASLEVFIANL